MSVRVYHGAGLAAYGFGDGHPFGPDRLDAFWREAKGRGLDQRIEQAAPVSASLADITLFHTTDYVDRVRTQSTTGVGYLDYGDTPAFRGVFEAASTVVGSVLDGVQWILREPGRRVFVPIAGLHHARRDRAGGFCVFNDPGIAIEALRARHGLKRIAYVDIDAHHGDGVFYAFEDDPELIFADMHEDGRYLYPGTGSAHETGRGRAVGTKLNLPMPPGADEKAFRAAWEQVEAFVRAGQPQFIILQAGADSIAGDPLTHLQYSTACHAYAAGRLTLIAEQCCNGWVLALGGGGYNRANLAAAWCDVVNALLAPSTVH